MTPKKGSGQSSANPEPEAAEVPVSVNKGTEKAAEEKPYAILTVRFYRTKGFEVDCQGAEALPPGRVHRIMPRVYKQMRAKRSQFLKDQLRKNP